MYLFTGTPQDKSRHEILSQISILDHRVMPVKTRTLCRYFNQDDYFQPSTEKKAFSKELTLSTIEETLNLVDELFNEKIYYFL